MGGGAVAQGGVPACLVVRNLNVVSDSEDGAIFGGEALPVLRLVLSFGDEALGESADPTHPICTMRAPGPGIGIHRTNTPYGVLTIIEK